MIKTILFLIIIQFSVICSAQFQPNVKLKQATITTFTDIEVGINLANFPCLVPLLDEPTHAIFRNGNQLDLVIAARGAPLCNPLPINEPPHQFYSIGNLEEGTYNLQVRIVFFNTLFFPFGSDGFVYGTIQDIQVVTTTVPSLHWVSIGLLALLVLFVTLYRFNKNGKNQNFVSKSFLEID